MSSPVTLRLVDEDAWAELASVIAFKFFDARAQYQTLVPRLTVYLDARTGKLEVTTGVGKLRRHQQFVLGYVTQAVRDKTFRFHGPLWEGMTDEIERAFAAQRRSAMVLIPKVTKP